VVRELPIVNAINVACAAVREAERSLPLDASVEIRIGSRDSKAQHCSTSALCFISCPTQTLDLPETRRCFRPEARLSRGCCADSVAPCGYARPMS
jgi:hypothetical protein